MNDVSREEIENLVMLILELKEKIDDLEMRIAYVEQMIGEVSSGVQLENAIVSIIALRKKVKLEDLYSAFPSVDKAYIRTLLSKLTKKGKIKRAGRGIYEHVG